MRRVHSEGQRERNRMRNHTASKRGKYDLRARTPDGDVIQLIGLPEQYSLSVHPAA